MSPAPDHLPSAADRDHDVTVHGATGFVGRLVAAELARRAPAGLRLALSGRSRDRLEQVRAQLPGGGDGVAVVVADSADEDALARLAASSRVVVSTVGPYLRHGLPLVLACARAGTHYADLTGEPLFVRRAIDAADAAARASGARLVHSCGYDSVPSDLAVLLLAGRAGGDGAGGLTDVTLSAAARGGFSGGTAASMLAVVDEARRDRDARRLLGDPFGLSPDRASEPDVRQPSDAVVGGRDPDGRWKAPFVMAVHNTRIVRRSNALSGWAYGRDLRYGEALVVGRGPAGPVLGAGVGLATGAFAGLAALPPTRRLLERVLPAPGAGPDEATRSAGWFRSRVHARTAGGPRYVATVAAQGDPGYAATAVMLAESGLALAAGEGDAARGGSLTPATALGQALVTRLRAAGHTYSVDPV